MDLDASAVVWPGVEATTKMMMITMPQLNQSNAKRKPQLAQNRFDFGIYKARDGTSSRSCSLLLLKKCSLQKQFHPLAFSHSVVTPLAN